jgi:hypothetical protein
MEAASTSETSANFNQTTRRNIPDVHTRRRENLKTYPKITSKIMQTIAYVCQ